MATETKDQQDSKPQGEDRATEKAKAEAGVATHKQNAKLAHSDENAPESTRFDALDAGVPMLPGDPSEPVGPEDAFGEGDKRGDYSQRGDGKEHFESVPDPDGGKPILGPEDDDGGRAVVGYTPNTKMVAQTPRTEQVGDVKGEKGGVTTG